MTIYWSPRVPLSLSLSLYIYIYMLFSSSPSLPFIFSLSSVSFLPFHLSFFFFFFYYGRKVWKVGFWILGFELGFERLDFVVVIGLIFPCGLQWFSECGSSLQWFQLWLWVLAVSIVASGSLIVMWVWFGFGFGFERWVSICAMCGGCG